MVLFVRTIQSDDEIDHSSSSEEEEQDVIPQKLAVKKSKKKKQIQQPKVDKRREAINPNFSFDENEGDDDFGVVKIQQSWDFEAAIKSISKSEHPSQRNTTSLEDKIQLTLQARKRREEKKKRKVKEQEKPEKESDKESSSEMDEEDENDSDNEEGKSESSSEIDEEDENESENEEGKDSDDEEGNNQSKNEQMEESEEESSEEEADTENVIHVASNRRTIEQSKSNSVVSFSQLNLSRPLLRAVKALGFERPTPIQARSIPNVLKGKDVCGSAVTGSGKTAAYLLPILERLLYRPRRTAATRVLIITPTRELAQQVLSMLQKLAQFTDVQAVAIVGGLSLQMQATELRGRPDIVVCTPGRLIDHVRNTQSVDLDDVEILVLDEADRLLELGFKDEINELVKFCPKQRQTLLFSATMTTEVDSLADISLNQPVRVEADPLYDMAQRLGQEFVRIRESRECDREAILLALCKRSFLSHTIVFFKRKYRAHRLGILFGLCGLKATELHGNLTQKQRLEALQRFRDGDVDFLLCTDLASRGLDIQGVRTVINFEMPFEMTTYVHRVGRTARAGRGGIAVTLVGEKQRKIMKEVLKRSKQNVKARQVPQGVTNKCRELIESYEEDIRDVLRQEKVEKEIRISEMEANKAKNMMEHRDEIVSRPQRTWFQSAKQKDAIKLASKERSDALENSEAAAKTAKQRRKEKRKLEREAEKNKVPHRMTRKKRRRMELLASEKEDAQRALQEAAEAADERGAKLTTKEKKKLAVPLEKQIEVSVKQAKRKSREEQAQDGKNILSTVAKRMEKRNYQLDDSHVSQKSRTPAFDVSGGGFDADLGPGGALSAIDARMNKKKKKGLLQDFVFKEHDVMSKGGLRKGGKQGRNKFKSRRKFKRR